MKMIFLEKKSNLPSEEKILAYFSLFLEHNKGQETIFEGPQGLFDDFFAIFKNLSLGPKRSVAIYFPKISCSHGDRSFWLTFHSYISCDTPPGTVHKDPRSFWTFTVEVLVSFLQDLRGC